MNNTTSSTFGYKGDHKLLAENLMPDEVIECTLQGTFAPELEKGISRSGVIAITNKRVILADKGLISREVAFILLESVSGVSYSTGLLFGGCHIHSRSGTGYTVGMANKKEAKAFANHLSTKVKTDQ